MPPPCREWPRASATPRSHASPSPDRRSFRAGAYIPTSRPPSPPRAASGGALDATVRERVGATLGDPLADVRVHADERADTLARSVSARAFTTGADIFFARGEYRPRTASGDALLAHELTHVLQQRGSPTTGPLTVTDPAGALEAEADETARELGGG